MSSLKVLRYGISEIFYRKVGGCVFRIVLGAGVLGSDVLGDIVRLHINFP